MIQYHASLSRVSGKVVVILLLALAVVGCKHSSDSGHMAKAMDYMAYRLDFDDQQKQILDELLAEGMAISEETKSSRQQNKEEFLALIAADTLDTVRIEQIAARHHQTSNLYLPRLLPIFSRLHATLTDEQKEKIERAMTKSKGHHH